MNDKLFVNEIFGPTWQGEGPSVGQVCHFLRLSGCSHFCFWCDSAFSWRFNDKHPHRDNIVYDKSKEVHEYTIDQLILNLSMISPNFLVVSGGEPMLQSYNLWLVLQELWDTTNLEKIEVETTGTIWSDDLIKISGLRFNVSPKLENSRNPKELRYKPDVLRQFRYSGKAIFKFVVSTFDDLEEVREIIDDIRIPKWMTWIMVEGITKEQQEKNTAKFINTILSEGWNFTPRLHVQLFGNKRGV